MTSIEPDIQVDDAGETPRSQLSTNLCPPL
jgi:hypothetical protein